MGVWTGPSGYPSRLEFMFNTGLLGSMKMGSCNFGMMSTAETHSWPEPWRRGLRALSDLHLSMPRHRGAKPLILTSSAPDPRRHVRNRIGDRIRPRLFSDP